METLYWAPEMQELELDGKPVEKIMSWIDESSETTREVVVWVDKDRVVDKGQKGLQSPAPK